MSPIDELRGTTLYTSAPGGANDVMLRQVLCDSGIDPDEDVTITYTGDDMHDAVGAMDAFRAGRYGPVMLSSRVEPLIKEGFPD
jgi:ABC-type nitrate/sulfonate/bicarbonate transport system substrate-binding protein